MMAHVRNTSARVRSNKLKGLSSSKTVSSSCNNTPELGITHRKKMNHVVQDEQSGEVDFTREKTEERFDTQDYTDNNGYHSQDQNTNASSFHMNRHPIIDGEDDEFNSFSTVASNNATHRNKLSRNDIVNKNNRPYKPSANERIERMIETEKPEIITKVHEKFNHDFPSVDEESPATSKGERRRSSKHRSSSKKTLSTPPPPMELIELGKDNVNVDRRSHRDSHAFDEGHQNSPRSSERVNREGKRESTHSKDKKGDDAHHKPSKHHHRRKKKSSSEDKGEPAMEEGEEKYHRRKRRSGHHERRHGGSSTERNNAEHDNRSSHRVEHDDNKERKKHHHRHHHSKRSKSRRDRSSSGMEIRSQHDDNDSKDMSEPPHSLPFTSRVDDTEDDRELYDIPKSNRQLVTTQYSNFDENESFEAPYESSSPPPSGNFTSQVVQVIDDTNFNMLSPKLVERATFKNVSNSSELDIYNPDGKEVIEETSPEIYDIPKRTIQLNLKEGYASIHKNSHQTQQHNMTIEMDGCHTVDSVPFQVINHHRQPTDSLSTIEEEDGGSKSLTRVLEDEATNQIQNVNGNEGEENDEIHPVEHNFDETSSCSASSSGYRSLNSSSNNVYIQSLNISESQQTFEESNDRDGGSVDDTSEKNEIEDVVDYERPIAPKRQDQFTSTMTKKSLNVEQEDIVRMGHHHVTTPPQPARREVGVETTKSLERKVTSSVREGLNMSSAPIKEKKKEPTHYVRTNTMDREKARDRERAKGLMIEEEIAKRKEELCRKAYKMNGMMDQREHNEGNVKPKWLSDVNRLRRNRESLLQKIVKEDDDVVEYDTDNTVMEDYLPVTTEISNDATSRENDRAIDVYNETIRQRKVNRPERRILPAEPKQTFVKREEEEEKEEVDHDTRTCESVKPQNFESLLEEPSRRSSSAKKEHQQSSLLFIETKTLTERIEQSERNLESLSIRNSSSDLSDAISVSQLRSRFESSQQSATRHKNENNGEQLRRKSFNPHTRYDMKAHAGFAVMASLTRRGSTMFSKSMTNLSTVTGNENYGESIHKTNHHVDSPYLKMKNRKRGSEKTRPNSIFTQLYNESVGNNDVSDDGEETNKTWQPSKFIENMYVVQTITEEEMKINNYQNISGYLDRFLVNKVSNNFQRPSTWKQVYCVVNSGFLTQYTDDCSSQAQEQLELYGGHLEEDQGNKQITLQDSKKQRKIVLRTSNTFVDSEKYIRRWVNTVRANIVQDMSKPFIVPSPVSKGPSFLTNILVVDIGGSSIRAGIAAKWPTLPKLFFPSAMAVEHLQDDAKYFGIDAFAPEIRSRSKLCNPFIQYQSTGRKDEFDFTAFQGVMERIFKELSVERPDIRLQLSLSTNITSRARCEIASLIFDVFQVEYIHIGHQSTFALKSYEVSSGVIVDCGERMDVFPVIDGVKVNSGSTHSNVGGKEIRAGIRTKLHKRNYPLTSFIDENYIVRHVMEKACFIAPNFEKAIRQSNEKDGNDESNLFEVKIAPEGTENAHIQKIHLNPRDRFEMVEPLFKPELIGMDQAGIHVLVHKAIRECNVDLRRGMAQSIFLSGGLTQVEGLRERLERELEKLSSFPIRVHASPYRYHAAYIGATVDALNEDFDDRSTSAYEWKTGEGVDKFLRSWFV